ncbi:MAG: hypothetical protein ACYDHD_02605 [Vulcanimicrobiaceae bacterium]
MLVYESVAGVLCVAIFAAIEAYRRRKNVLLLAQQQLVIVLGIFALLAILSVAAALLLATLRAGAQVTACESNETTIAAALAAWESTYGNYPAVSAIPVVAHTGSTAGTFSAPGAPAADLLSSTPVDPVNPAGQYTLTVVPGTAAASETYTIICPGPHPLGSLSSLPGGKTATKGQIILSNGAFSAQ